jgi:excinuclease ABC subunit C
MIYATLGSKTKEHIMDDKVKHLPTDSGIYIFKNSIGEIIYIGKAKSIRKRVATYFQKQHNDWKVKALSDEYATIDFIQTKNETEALLLEAQMVRDNKPKFNVLLTSGQPFVYIMVTQEDLPQLVLVRNKKEKGTYFGPFLHKAQARGALEYIIRTFKLELCDKKIPSGCLKYHLDLCAGSCMDVFNKEEYLFRLKLAIEVLKGGYDESLKLIKQQIAKHNAVFEFEKSQKLHRYLENLTTIFTTLKTRFTEAKYSEAINWLKVAEKSYATYLQTAQELQELFNLKKAPMTIDCFDISHFQSSAIVGSCIRFTAGKPDKNNFRRFMVRSLVTQNDYAALQEIVTRRYRDRSELPDLVLIDGGKGQLSAVQAVLHDMQCISLAKREEIVYSNARPEGVPLRVETPVGKLLIELRDYAHHFAITYHRLRRKKMLE